MTMKCDLDLDLDPVKLSWGVVARFRTLSSRGGRKLSRAG